MTPTPDHKDNSAQKSQGPPPAGGLPAATGRNRFIGRGLSGKLLVLTILFVMIAEVLIYVPSVANFRNVWLTEKLEAASVAAITAAAGPESGLPTDLQKEMLSTIGLEAIAMRSKGQRMLIASGDMPAKVDARQDLSGFRPFLSIYEAFSTLLSSGERMISVGGRPPAESDLLEIVIREEALRNAMLIYSRNILILSLMISIFSATLVYLALKSMIVRPIERLSANLTSFAEAPEDPDRTIVPSGRDDEIGLVEDRLATMQSTLRETLHKQRHLADLGLAVSKINHDLRNILASAQLFSDRLETTEDPLVKRFAPKIVGAIDRAIGYTRSVLAYGQADEELPNRQLVALSHIIDDVADVLGLSSHESIAWENRLPSEIEIDADPDQLFRAVMNLCRNAIDALERNDDPAIIRRIWAYGDRKGGVVRLQICDTGPGVPQKARAELFRPFRGSARPGGTGLGLAIAAEIVRAHGGDIRLVAQTGPGTTFEVLIPDRPVDFHERRRARILDG